MAKEFDESLFEDVPIQEDQMDQDLFEDVEYDESLFEEVPEKTTSEKATDIAAQLSPVLVGGAATYGAGMAAEAVAEPLKGLAEDLAFSASGADKNILREYLERTPEMRQEQLIKPRDVGRRALDEGILIPTEKKLDRLKGVSKESRKKLQEFLGKAEKKADPKKVLERYKKLMRQEAADSVAEADIDLRKLSESPQESERFLEALGEEGLSAEQLEEMKRKIDFDPTATGARKRAEDIKKRTLKEASEELIKRSGLDPEEFRKLKKLTGEEAILERGAINQLAKGESRVPRLSPYGVRYAPGIETARGITEKFGKPMAAKGADIASKAAKPFAKVLKILPLVGAGAAFAAEKAEGATDTEAAARTALEEAGDVVLPVGLALRSEALGPQRGSLEDRLERGELSPQEQREAMFGSAQTSGKPMSPERIQELKAKLKQIQKPSAQEMANELSKVESGDVEERAQAEYKLQQQPAFKEYLRRLEEAKKRES